MDVHRSFWKLAKEKLITIGGEAKEVETRGSTAQLNPQLFEGGLFVSCNFPHSQHTSRAREF
jgi:hypothetical protein